MSASPSPPQVDDGPVPGTEPRAEGSPSDKVAHSAPSPRSVRSVAIAMAAFVVAALFLIAALLPESRSPVTYRFVIPPGTARQLAAGANISLFPERLVIDKGDVIDLVNQDNQNDEVGPFFVPANGELRQSVNRPGTYSGTCTLHRSGKVVIVVR